MKYIFVDKILTLWTIYEVVPKMQVTLIKMTQWKSENLLEKLKRKITTGKLQKLCQTKLISNSKTRTFMTQKHMHN